MVKRKDRRARRQILQLREERRPNNVQQHALVQIGYSDSSEDSDGEDASRENQSSNNNEVKDVIDEQVADFLKEIDAISTATDNEAATDAAPEHHSCDSQPPAEVPVQDLSAVSTPGAQPASVCSPNAAKENGGSPSAVDTGGWACAWQQCQDEETGYAYYWNVETNEVTWECPQEYLVYITALTQAAAAAAAPPPPPPEEAEPSEPVPSSTECAAKPKEGEIIPITSYGSSSEESDGEVASHPEALAPSTTRVGHHNLACRNGPLEYGPQLPAVAHETVTSSASAASRDCDPPPPAERDIRLRNQRPEPSRMVVYGPPFPGEFGDDVAPPGEEVRPPVPRFVAGYGTSQRSPEGSSVGYDPQLPMTNSGVPAKSERTVGSPTAYGPQFPPSSFKLPTVVSCSTEGSVTCGPQLLPASIWSSSVENAEGATVYGPQLPSAWSEQSKVSQSSESGTASQEVDICAAYGPQLPSSSEQQGVSRGPSLPLGDECDGFPPESSGTEASVEAVGSVSALRALIGYSSSPTQEDDKVASASTSDHVSAATTAHPGDTANVDYPIMVGRQICFGRTADTDSTRSQFSEDAEPDSTTRAVPSRPLVSVCDVVPSSSAQAAHLVSYGESDSEDDTTASTDVRSAPSGRRIDVDALPRSPRPSAAKKCSSKDARSATQRDTRGGDHPGFGFGGSEHADAASRALFRKKRLTNVKFVKSDEVLFLSGKPLDDDDDRQSDKEEIKNGSAEDSLVDQEGSDDEFDDVVRALDQALMESRRKEREEKELGLIREVGKASGPDEANASAASTEAGQLERIEAPESEQDMVIDSPSEAEPVTQAGDDEDTAEIEASFALVVAKLAHFNAAPERDGCMHDLAVQVQTRMEDWRAGALVPKYCRAKLREAHDFLQLREASMTLQSGWSCHWDSGTMRYFYTEETTGRAQWEFPTALEEPAEANGVDQTYGPQQLPTVTSSTSEASAATSAPAVVVSTCSEGRGEKRKAPDTVDAVPDNNQFATGEAVLYGPAPPVPSPTETIASVDPPSEYPQQGDCELPSTSAEETVASSSKRKKTKLSAGLALRKKNIPSLLQKWEKIKKEQKWEDSKQNL